MVDFCEGPHIHNLYQLTNHLVSEERLYKVLANQKQNWPPMFLLDKEDMIDFCRGSHIQNLCQLINHLDYFKDSANQKPELPIMAMFFVSCEDFFHPVMSAKILKI